MSLPRTPPNEASASGLLLPLATTSILPAATDTASGPILVTESVCQVCDNVMSESDDCLILTNCSHSFHRFCIENFLSTTAECPKCKRPCELVDLKKINLLQKQNLLVKPITRNRGRGAMAKQYNTRSQARNLFPDSQRSMHESIHVKDAEDISPSGRLTRQSPANSPHRNNVHMPKCNRNSRVSVDYDQINRMIENNITRILTNLHITPTSDTQTLPTHNENNNPERGHVNSNNFVYNTANRFNATSVSNSNSPSYNMDKVTSIISSWNIKFDGSPSGLSVGEFLYRIRSLTYDNFNGDFTPIVRNLNILLNGKAKDWYWRYRKSVDSFNWEEFCEAIKCQYRDFKSSFDIKEEIRNRKQKVGETFDVFYDSISSIMDRLHSPMSEMELIEILTRNLRPEIRQDLLYVPVHSISHLRKLVQMRESFLNDDHVRKNLTYRSQNQFPPRRQISEVNSVEDADGVNPTIAFESEVNSIQLQEKNVRCWNCDEMGHYWDDCLKQRNIFCYGCGFKNVYKPQCLKCSTRKLNLSKNLKTSETMKTNQQ